MPDDISRSGPTGSVLEAPSLPCPSATSSRLPPPRSPITPDASGMPQITPKPEKRASSWPLTIWALMPGRRVELAHEVLAVGGVAHGGGRQQVERRHLHVVRERREAVDVGQRHLDAFRIEAAVAADATAEAAEDLFVEQQQRGGPARR